MDVDARTARTALGAGLLAALALLALGLAGVLSLPAALPFVGAECPPHEPGGTAAPADSATWAATTTTAAATTARSTPGTENASGDGDSDGYARTTVVAYDANGTRLGTVRVRVAESYGQKYTGLSETDSLARDEGMLFPYDREDERTYVMRGMDFGIDIVYADGRGVVTRVHHAPEPPEDADGNDYRYPGCGQYVLEVPYNWTVRHGVDAGDRLAIAGYEE